MSKMDLKTISQGFEKMTSEIKEHMSIAAEPVSDVTVDELEDSGQLIPAPENDSVEFVTSYGPLLGGFEKVAPISQEDFQEIGTPAQLASLYASFAAAKGEFAVIKKSRNVKIKTSKGDYTFDYAPLDELLDCTTPALSKHGICILMPFGGLQDGAQVRQRIIMAHKHGARLCASYSWPTNSDMKVFGGETTYIQRYAYRSMCAIAADSDLDDMPIVRGQLDGSADASNRSKPGQASQGGQERGQVSGQANVSKNQPSRHAPGPSQTEQTTNRTTTIPTDATSPTVAKTASPAQSAGQLYENGKQTRESVSTPRGAKASKQSCADMVNLAKELGYAAPSKLGPRIFGVFGGEVLPIGNAGYYGSEMSQEQVDQVIESMVAEKTKKAGA